MSKRVSNRKGVKSKNRNHKAHKRNKAQARALVAQMLRDNRKPVPLHKVVAQRIGRRLTAMGYG